MHERRQQHQHTLPGVSAIEEASLIVTNPALQRFLDDVGDVFANTGEGGQFQLTTVIAHIRSNLGLSRGHADSVYGLICRGKAIDAEKKPGGKGQRYFVDKTGVLACAALLWTYKEQVKKRYGVYRMDKNVPRSTLPERARAWLGSHELAKAIRDPIQEEKKPKDQRVTAAQKRPPSPDGKEQVFNPAFTGAKRGRPSKTEQPSRLPKEARTPLLRNIPRIGEEEKQEAYAWGREQLVAVVPYLAARKNSPVNFHDPSFTEIMPRHIVQMVMFVDAARKGGLAFFHPSLEYHNEDDLSYADVKKAVITCLKFYFDPENPMVRNLGELFLRWVKELYRREQEKQVVKM